MEIKNNQTCRIDKWLWCARFFKTRSLASAAIKAGHVILNQYAAKPSSALSIGDQLIVSKVGLKYHIEILDLAKSRVSATQAQQLYQETPQSIEEREKMREQHKLERQLVQYDTQGRPDKHNRRKMSAAKRSSFGDD